MLAVVARLVRMVISSFVMRKIFVMSLPKLIWNKTNYFILGPILEIMGPIQFLLGDYT